MELAPPARLATFAGYSSGKKAVLTVLLKYASVSLSFLALSHLCTFAKVRIFYLLKHVKELRLTPGLPLLSPSDTTNIQLLFVSTKLYIKKIRYILIFNVFIYLCEKV